MRALLLSLDCSILPLIRTIMLNVKPGGIKNIFGMTQPGIQPQSSRQLANTLPARPMAQETEKESEREIEYVWLCTYACVNVCESECMCENIYISNLTYMKPYGISHYRFNMSVYIYIYIYIYIVIHRQTVSFYQNSSVWLDTQDARSRDRNPSNFTLD